GHGQIVARPGHRTGAGKILQLYTRLANDVDDRVVGDVGIGVGEKDDAQAAVDRVGAEVADHVAGDQVACRDRGGIGKVDASLSNVLDDVVLDEQVVDVEEVVIGIAVLDAAAGIDVDRTYLNRASAQGGVVAVDDQSVDGDVVGDDTDKIVGVGIAACR